MFTEDIYTEDLLDPLENNNDEFSSSSSETDSDEETKQPDFRKKRRRGNTSDNIIGRSGKVLSSLFHSLSMGASQKRQQPAQTDSSSA